MEHCEPIERYPRLRKVNGSVWSLVPLHKTRLQQQALIGDPTPYFTEQCTLAVKVEVMGANQET